MKNIRDRLTNIPVSLSDNAKELWEKLPFDPEREKMILHVHAQTKLNLGLRMPYCECRHNSTGEDIIWQYNFTVFTSERLSVLLRALFRKRSVISEDMTLRKIFK